MTKEELLQELSGKISTGEVTKEEILSKFSFAPSALGVAEVKEVKVSHFSVTKLFYGLGAIIAIIGMVLFAYQIWDGIGSFGRVLITLGLGLLLTGIGSFLSRNTEPNSEDTVGMVFHFLGGMLIPGGTVVALREFLPNSDLAWPLAFSFFIVFLFYLFINYIHKNAILTFFTIANGTAFVYLIVHAIVGNTYNDSVNLYSYLTIILGAAYIMLARSFQEDWSKRLAPALYFFGFFSIQCAAFAQYSNAGGRNSFWPVVFSLGLIFFFYLFLNFSLKKDRLTLLTIFNGTAFVYTLVQALIGGSFYQNGDIYAYLTMVIGAVYLLLSYSFRGDTTNGKIVEVLNFFGIIGLLGAAFSEIYGSLPWQLFYFLLVIGSFVFSVYVRSRIILIFSTIFLLSFISYITKEYFANSLGWPVSLVILGFLFIGLGYISISINRKYIQAS